MWDWDELNKLPTENLGPSLSLMYHASTQR